MGTSALQALLDEAVQQRAAVVAEGEPLVGVHHEPVRHVHVEALAAAHAHAALLLQRTAARQSAARRPSPAARRAACLPPPSCRGTWSRRTSGSACGRRTCTLRTKAALHSRYAIVRSKPCQVNCDACVAIRGDESPRTIVTINSLNGTLKQLKNIYLDIGNLVFLDPWKQET